MMYKIPESVLVVIYRANLEVLLLERADHPGFWQSVTGSKDTPAESLIETAQREVFEETGLIIGNYQPPVIDTGLITSATISTAAISTAAATAVFTRIALDRLQAWNLQNRYAIYPLWRHRYAPGVTQNTEHVFSLEAPADAQIYLAAREHSRYRWLPYQEAAAACFSASNQAAILELPQRLA